MTYKEWEAEYKKAHLRALANDPKSVLATASHLARIQFLNDRWDFIESHPELFTKTIPDPSI